MIDAHDLRGRYAQVRAQTEHLCAPLAIEDLVAQSMPDCSPTKWHLAHTAWFFEAFTLEAPLAPRYQTLFNSYYHAVGPRHPRPQRGLLTRPTVAEVLAYRAAVDQAMEARLATAAPALQALITLGLHHEEQHQELMITDIKHLFFQNPLRPRYDSTSPPVRTDPAPLQWRAADERIREVGHAGQGFAFDHESPRHRVLVPAFLIADRLTTAGEYLAFVQDGGYRRSEWWLSDGWDWVQSNAIRAPLYWEERDGAFQHFTLRGDQPLDLGEPVRHLSYYEADAYARWAGARLPTEVEWESAATTAGLPLAQLYDQAWQWTQSPYVPYPGYRPAAGAIGEYNGKFMCNQMVLRGGSSATPAGHSRATYRNFFPPGARWQLTGLRLARDSKG